MAATADSSVCAVAGIGIRYHAPHKARWPVRPGLEAAGLVTTRREGRYKLHHLDTAPLREITDRWPTPTNREKEDR